MSTLNEVGAYEAKTHLPEMLRKVREGAAFLITQRGEPVAELVPAGSNRRQQGTEAARRMQALMQRAPVPLAAGELRALLDQGRD